MVAFTAWAEAATPGLGSVAFDAVHDLCPNAGDVRVAVGFDALGAAPFRGAHSGGGDEAVTAAVRIEQAMGAEAELSGAPPRGFRNQSFDIRGLGAKTCNFRGAT